MAISSSGSGSAHTRITTTSSRDCAKNDNDPCVVELERLGCFCFSELSFRAQSRNHNSAAWDFSPKVSPDGTWFFFTSNRGFADKPLEKRLTYKELLQKLHSPGNGLRDIYKIDISALNLAAPK
jgi:hypothetical protein